MGKKITDPTSNNSLANASKGWELAAPPAAPNRETMAKSGLTMSTSKAYKMPSALPSESTPTLLITTRDLPTLLIPILHAAGIRHALVALKAPGPVDNRQENRGHHEREGEADKGDQRDVEERKLGTSGGEGAD